MRTLASMTEEDKRTYMTMLANATKEVMPADGQFAIVIFGPNKSVNWIASVRRLEIPALLRVLADHMEANIAASN